MFWSVVCHPRSCGRVDFTVDETALVDVVAEDNVRLCAYSIGAYLALLDDSPIADGKPLVHYQRLLRMLTADFVFTIQRFSRLADSLLREGADTPEFINEMRHTPIFFEYVRWYKTRDERLFQYILTFLRFLKRLEMRMPHLAADAFRNWQKTEERIGSFDEEMSDDIRVFLHAVLPKPDYSFFKPKFGPGLTADVRERSSIVKSHKLTVDSMLARLLRPGVIPSPDPTRSFAETLPYELAEGEKVPNVLTFVPKDPSKVRSICMCTNAEMFFQQGVLNMLTNAFRRSPYLDAAIRLRSQERNQVKAYLGSIYRSLDTIDLSDASDTVCWDLVKKVMPAKWLYLLRVTRSSLVATPDGEVVKVKKFAPMGSAVCFPVQCLIFLGAVYSASVSWALQVGLINSRPISSEEVNTFIRSTYVDVDDAPYMKGKLLSPVVYGDDIICDSKVTSYVFRTLHSLGFVVNEKKSFCGDHAVRESCGKYYMNGVDITPLNLKTPYFDRAFHAEAFASILDQADLCFDRQLFRLRSYLLHAWEHNAPRWIKKLSANLGCSPLGLTRVGRKVRRYCIRYQREEAYELAGVTKSKKADVPTERWDAMSLYLWQHYDHRDEPSHAHPRRVPYSMRYEGTYVPV